MCNHHLILYLTLQILHLANLAIQIFFTSEIYILFFPHFADLLFQGKAVLLHSSSMVEDSHQVISTILHDLEEK